MKAATRETQVPDSEKVKVESGDILVVRGPHLSRDQAAKIEAELKSKVPQAVVVVLDTEQSLERITALAPQAHWENKIIDLDGCTFEERHEKLNGAGVEGFELVTVESGLAYLKRPTLEDAAFNILGAQEIARRRQS